MSTQIKPLPLSDGITSRVVRNVNGLDIHVLEAGAPSTVPASNSQSPHIATFDSLLGGAPVQDGKRKLVILLHGFPELAYSFRKIIEPLALSGYHVVAPDQRGYGRTTGWSSSDGASFRVLNLVADVVALVLALGYRTAACVVGHDFGSLVAGYCALVRPDMFHSVIFMSAPFSSVPSFCPPSNTYVPSPEMISNQLAALDPPRKHYQHYFASPSSLANNHMLYAPQGLSAFLRAYFHMKSADWTQNNPHPLSSWSASVLSEMPEYYIMHADKTMAQTVAPHDPRTEASWLTVTDLAVYTEEFSRTSFQGGLNWYQFSISAELRIFSEKSITVPALFIAGDKDWGMYQAPGGIARMQEICERMDPTECCVVKRAGHWVQQERPEEVVKFITLFLASFSVADTNDMK